MDLIEIWFNLVWIGVTFGAAYVFYKVFKSFKDDNENEKINRRD